MHATLASRRPVWEPAVIALAPAALAALITLSVDSPLRVLALGAGATFCVWLLLSERLGRSLLLLMLYLGLLDGVLRLSTGIDELTVVRDVFLYSIVAGLMIRALVRRTPLHLPPLGGWVALFAVAVLVQLANPLNGTVVHAVSALRPHLEFVPLFVLGYLAMRELRRLEIFLVLVIVIGAANGLATFVQFNMTPEQLARWGPGYESRVFGTDVSARQFVDSRGNRRPRPFGLGADSAAGGAFSMIACAAPLALLALSLHRRRIYAVIGLVGAACIALGVVTSQQRSSVLGAVAVLGGFLLLAFGRRRLVAPVVAVAAVAVVGYLVIGALASSSTVGSFDRYREIAPGQVLSTAIDYRRDDLAAVPDYLVEFPLGAGLGSVGPASGAAGAPPNRGLNAEGQLNFLVLELGIAGTLAFGAFVLALLRLIVRRLPRITAPDLRLALAAIAAPLLGILVWSLGGVVSTLSPMAPYLWFSAGVLAFWLGRRDAPDTVAAR
jgi:hypothetical protein